MIIEQNGSKIFTGRTMPPCSVKIFVMLILTCKLFSVTLLLVGTRSQKVVDICLEMLDFISGRVNF